MRACCRSGAAPCGAACLSFLLALDVDPRWACCSAAAAAAGGCCLRLPRGAASFWRSCSVVGLSTVMITVTCSCFSQCWTLTGITFPDNQTRSWLTSQNNQKVVLTGIQYHFGPGAETGPDRPSRALEPSDRHLHTPKQPLHFKYHLFSCRIRPSPAVSGRFRPYSYVFQSIGAVRCRGSRLNTAPLELKRIKLESGIRKYQLTIPLSKSIKEWSIPL